MNTKKLSIPHWDRNLEDNIFISWLSKNSQDFINNIESIYFGGTFKNENVKYSNVMGAEPSYSQYKNLLKIQEKFNIPISLTLNDSNKPYNLLESKNLKDLINYIDSFYQDGVRSCTISHTHLMRTGILQENFPDMEWKNTVNHRVKSTQEAIDYAALGYNTILLDRSLNRDIKELNKIYKEQTNGYLKDIKTTLLAVEDCMPECVFKEEHDSWNNQVKFNKNGGYFPNIAENTCIPWKNLNIPRFGTSIELYDNIDYFNYTVDTFKISGRNIQKPQNISPGFLISPQLKGITHQLYVDNFNVLLDNNIPYLSNWLKGIGQVSNNSIKTETNITKIKEILEEFNQETTIHYNKLTKALQNCKNQCYSCHLCEKIYNIEPLRSIVDIKI